MERIKTKLVVKSNSLLARIACRKLKSKSVALVTGRTIHLYGINPIYLLGNKEWLSHELVHVKQFERYGLFRFLAMYFWEWIKHGYHMNRFEIEARQNNNHPDSVVIFEEYDFEIK